MYLADTLNLEDDIVLMETSKEFNDLIHCDLSGVPIEHVKDAGMDIVHKAINIIMHSKEIMGYDHYLRNTFAAQQGVNIKQYKENHYNIGTKPDGQGSIYHDIINQSYITGGLNKLLYQLIDSGSSRVAQIISKRSVGETGGFSRVLGLNNINSYLYPDPEFDCHTRNYVHLPVLNKEFLYRLKDRFYKLHQNGPEFLLHKEDTFLIGKYIYLRSPITCQSHAMGHGVCYRCYGNLAYTNADISIGRIASELLTSQYTQKKLSAKHQLETSITVIDWNGNFKIFFTIEINTIKLNESIPSWEGFKLIIDPEQIQLENDDEFFQHNYFSMDNHLLEDEGPFYNEFLTDVVVVDPNGEEFVITSETKDGDTKAKMYLSTELTTTIRDIVRNNQKEEIDEDLIVIPMELLEDKTLFLIKLENNDLGKNFDIFNDLIDKKNITKALTKDTIVEKLLETVISGGIDCQSVHLEVLISNQIRSIDDRLKNPNWTNPDEPYELLTLKESLTDSPSVINSLIYRELAKTLYYPLTYKKTGTSIFDILFMRTPKKFLNADHEVYGIKDKSSILPGQSPIVFVRPGQQRPVNFNKTVRDSMNLEKTEL